MTGIRQNRAECASGERKLPDAQTETQMSSAFQQLLIP